MEQSLSSYRIFYVVALEGNISRAAERLFISQPAISRSIRKLEDSLETTLFLRSSRGVVLTEEGKILFDHVKEAFDAIQLGEEQIHKVHTLGMGHLRIGTSTTLCKYLLLPYLKPFIQTYPHVQISISCQSTAQTLQLLKDGRLDLGLTGSISHPGPLTFEPFAVIEDIFVATSTYMSHLPQDMTSTREILEASTLMLLDKNNMTRQYIDDYLAKNQIQTKDYIEISNMDLLIEFAKIGVGVACVIKNFVQEELADGQLQQIPLDIPIHKRDVGFAYKKTHLQNDALSCFLDFCRG